MVQSMALVLHSIAQGSQEKELLCGTGAGPVGRPALHMRTSIAVDDLSRSSVLLSRHPALLRHVVRSLLSPCPTFLHFLSRSFSLLGFLYSRIRMYDVRTCDIFGCAELHIHMSRERIYK